MVIQGVIVMPSGGTSDGIGPNHSFEVYKDGLELNYRLETSRTVIAWKDVRSVQLLNGGWFDIWATIRTQSMFNPGNPMNPDGSYTGSGWEDQGTFPAHFRFVLATQNMQHDLVILNALQQLVAANQSGSSN